jgi:hypothetical protein
MRRKNIAITCAAVTALAFILFYYFYGGSTTPRGRPPLVRLNNSNLAALRESFNRSTGSVRLLVLLSPT